MLSSEQTAQIKTQILQQIENFPADKKDLARQQIEAMSPEELENFIEKNQLAKSQNNGQECIFCSIQQGKIQSYKLEENASATAIFEINPISRGHILIIPKEHEQFKDKVPKRLENFARKIAKEVKEKLNPKKVEIHPANLFGHGVLNILPIYESETMESERHRANPEELSELQKIFEPEELKVPKPSAKPRESATKRKKEKIKGKIWLPKRIP